MIYKRFYLVVSLYLCSVLLLAVAFAFTLKIDITYSIIILAALVGLSVSFGVWLNRTNKKLAYFFSSVRNDDTSLYFPEGIGFEQEKLLNQSLNDLNTKLKNAKLNIELQEKFYKSIMERLRTGIISFFENGVVEFANPEFKRMFDLDHIPHIGKLKSIDPKLVELLQKIGSGEQKRINLKVGHNLMSLAVHSQTIIIRNREVKTVTLQDIKSELEMHEMDSWQKLIRILNHEIMNSVAPITSLSSTLSSYYKSGNKHKDPGLITQRIISDTIKGLNIIEDHGNGLIHFVESYRSMTRMPKPEFARINIKDFFEKITILVNSYIDSESEKNKTRPEITTSVSPDDLSLVGDDKLLAQVLFNVVKNSVEAFGICGPGNEISIYASRNAEGRVELTVKDNGPGMDAETLEKIFVPFFTTKESGSGIGLSLSRQIMRIHNGNISCESCPGGGTSVTMIF